MPKYLCLQRSLPASSGARPSPAEMQEMYAKFDAWREQFKDHLVERGGRLGAGRVVVPTPAPDGPYPELKELVGGYMIVAAASLDEAARIASACPGLVRPGSGVEVLEIRTPG